MDVTDRTLAALGFDDVRAALGGRCRTDVGKARGLARPFLPGAEAVREALALVAEARTLKSEPLTLPLAGVTDVRPALDRASKGGMVEPRDLMAVCQSLFAFERAHEVLLERKERYPGLYAIGRRLPQLSKLATRLDRCFESSGEISDRASPALRDAREHARGLHKRIRSRLDELLHDEKFVTTLQDTYYSVRNDRYVVPVSSAHQRAVPGIVHNASQSGQTLFVEPTELIGLGNDLAIAQSVVLEEERKVLLELSSLVAREAPAIEAGVLGTAELDELEAAALLSNDLLAVTPLVEPTDGTLHVRGLRHPRLLLKGGEVIANEVELAGDARALVISGPNAGGKTVTLTAVGLCALMVRAGLPVPVDEGSRIPLFNQVHSAIGDQQDMQLGLSTFSAHVTFLKEITQTAKKGALVLIDEIAADTDPREGAAIATAVLEDLLEKGALVLVTTHLEELKSLAHVDPRFVNARVGFDSKRMAPTYRLQLGFAGASSAIDIARRVGLLPSICDRALDLARNAGGALSKALTATEEERRRLFDLREMAERESAEAKALKERLEADLAEALRARKEDELKFRQALKAELEFAKQQLKALAEQLTAGEKTAKTAKAAQAAVTELGKRATEQATAERALTDELRGPPVETAPLVVQAGARARHQGLDAEVEILEVQGDTVTVSMGSLKMRVPVSELGPPRRAKEAPRPPASARKERQLEKAAAVSAQVLTMAAPKLDLRGQRAEDAVRQVESFLDRATRTGEPAVVILHGHGTGALKTSVRSYLEGSPYVGSSRPGDGPEGGDGVTIVVMKE